MILFKQSRVCNASVHLQTRAHCVGEHRPRRYKPRPRCSPVADRPLQPLPSSLIVPVAAMAEPAPTDRPRRWSPRTRSY